MKAIFFSDIHFHFWQQFNADNKRLKSQLGVFEKLVRIADREKVPLFFGGDLFNSPKEIANELLGYVIPYLKSIFEIYPAVRVFAISGNHDMSKPNTLSHRSPSYVKTLGEIFNNFVCLDFEEYTSNEFNLFGIPYLEHNSGLMEYANAIKLNPEKKNILLIHTAFKGQKDTNGVVVGDGENLVEKDFNRFDIVFSGHVHKHSLLQKNIISIGAPLQLRASDSDGRFGYWVLSDNLLPRFVEIRKTPKFRYYSDDSEKTNNTDFWIKVPKEEEDIKIINLNAVSLDRIKVVRGYLQDSGVISKKRKRILTELIHNTIC
jgi:DNA repair exonuclease SbcCD nuclease subunit